MNIKKTIAAAALAVGLTTVGFAAQTGPHGASFARHGMGGPLQGRMLERAATALSLTDTQKEFAKQLAADTKKQAEPIVTELRQNRQELASAVKANNTGAITTLTQRQGELTAQVSALHAKAMASFYAQLTPEQRAKADQMHSQRKERMQNWKERRGSRGNAQPAQ